LEYFEILVTILLAKPLFAGVMLVKLIFSDLIMNQTMFKNYPNHKSLLSPPAIAKNIVILDTTVFLL